MSEIQAEIEFMLELRKFINIDLFVQGYYQVRTAIRFAPKIQSATKIEIKSPMPPMDDSNDSIYPATTLNEWGISKTFLIIFKNEEVILDDQINFKLSVIVDAQNIIECFNKFEMQLLVELYFIERDFSPDKLSVMQQLCSRCYKLHFNPLTGLHVHVPIIFDYFHLSAVLMTIHGSLLCLIPPYVFDRPNAQRSSLFSFLFGQDLSQIVNDNVNPALLDRAYTLHNNICEILLSSYETLQDFYEKMLEKLPDNEQKPSHVHQNCQQKRNNLCEKLRGTEDVHTIDNLAHAHIAQCSAENIMLWCQFIQLFSLSDLPALSLAKEYHFKRARRFSEGFFLRETSRLNLLTNESDSFNDLHEIVRNSPYYCRLPPLPIECVELDGVPDTLPIIIEEIYSPILQQQSAVKNNMNKSVSTAVQNNSKARPNLALCLRGNADDTITTPPTSPYSSLPLSSARTVTTPKIVNTSFTSSPLTTNVVPSSFSSSSTPDRRAATLTPTPSVSTPLVRHGSTAKALLSFRSQTPTTNPIIPFSDDPSIQLTAYRKVADSSPQQEQQPQTSSPSSVLSTYQSDSDLNRRTNSKLKTRLHKYASRYSLPNVPFERTTNGNLTPTSASINDSPTPRFLLSADENDVSQQKQNNNIDDNVFDQSAAATFGDSSFKSKVLQASFRGKMNTINRQRFGSDSSTTPIRRQQNGQTLPNNSNRKSRQLFLSATYEKPITDINDITTTMENENNDIVRPIPSSLDSMLNLTLRLEQSALNSVRAASSKTDNDYHRRHTVSTPNDLNQYHENYRRSDVPNDPLLINGLTSDENTLNLMEQAHDEVIKKNKKNPQQQSSNVATIDDKNGRSIVTTETQQEKEKRMSKHLNVAITNNNGRLTSASPNSQIEYFVFKQKLKDSIVSRFNGVLYSDCSSIVSNTPYFYSELVPLDENGVHLIICVHGLDGNSGDLRLIKTYLELCLPSSRLDFLMSSSNHNTTFDDIDIMVGNLINEIDTHIERFGIKAQRISFVGHSLGNLVVRAAVANPRFERYRPMLYTYLSLSGPHLGTLFNSSGLVNMGMWLMQKWKKSCSLSQMSFKDHVDPKQTYLYKLSKKPCLEYFKNILLIASPQDRYVPFHSARIEVCKAALKDTVYGSIYVEMISNLLEPIIKNSSINFVRYNAFHNIQSGTNNLIGRAAHIAILDSELFVEKLVLVSAAKYFK